MKEKKIVNHLIGTSFVQRAFNLLSPPPSVVAGREKLRNSPHASLGELLNETPTAAFLPPFLHLARHKDTTFQVPSYN